MNIETLQKQYDAETQHVARIAKSIQTHQPELSWSECIRIAEKTVQEKKQ